MTKQFQYFLLTITGLFLYVDDNGKVRTTSTPTPLPNAPDSWQEKKLSWGRSSTYLGLIREFTTKLSFTTDGAKILRHLRYTKGVEAYCRLVIVKLDKSFGEGMVHKDFYGGEIDFSKWDDKDDTVTTEVKDGGLAKLIKANENTDYEIPVDELDMLCSGYKQKTAYSLAIFPHTLSVSNTFPNGSTVLGHNVGITQVASEGNKIGLVVQDVFGESVGGSPDYLTDTRYFNRAVMALTVNYNAPLKFRLRKIATTGTGGHCKIRIINQNETIIQTLFEHNFSTTNFDQTFEIPNVFSLNVPNEERLFLDCTLRSEVGGGGSCVVSIQFLETTWSVDYTYLYPSTIHKANTLKKTAERILSKLAGSDVIVKSDLFNSRPDLVNTSGLALRGRENPTQKSSFSNFFKSVRTPLPLGFGVEQVDGVDVAVFEPMEYFFRDEVLVNLGQVIVNDGGISNADEWMGNKIKIGYPNQTYDKANGLDEFNVTQYYTSAITKLVKEIDLVSDFRADPNGIEQTRIEGSVKNATDADSRSDNDNFFLQRDHVTPNFDGSYNLLRLPQADVTGVNFPDTIFNVPLSPKTCLYAHARRMRSMFYHNEGTKLVFQTSDKNAELSYVRNGQTITERSDVTVGDFQGGALWLPYLVKFTTQVPVNMVELMQGTNKYKKIEFEYRDTTWRGWIITASQQPADNEKQEWTLLLSYDNDLTKLI